MHVLFNKINISPDAEYLKVRKHTGTWYLMRQSHLHQVFTEDGPFFVHSKVWIGI